MASADDVAIVGEEKPGSLNGDDEEVPLLVLARTHDRYNRLFYALNCID